MNRQNPRFNKRRNFRRGERDHCRCSWCGSNNRITSIRRNAESKSQLKDYLRPIYLAARGEADPNGILYQDDQAASKMAA